MILLKEELKKEGFSVQIVPASKRNDIQQEARRRKRSAVLLEIMDETTKQEATKIGKAVREWSERFFF